MRKLHLRKRKKKDIQKTVTELIELCENAISRLKIHAEPMLVGSVAKDTYLKNPDIDIFILFPLDTKRETLEQYGLKIGEHVIPKPVKKYAEHPYTSGKFHGYEVDIVPCYRIKKSSELKSAVDRTPLHTEYVINNLAEKQKNEVRLLKQFLKGIGIYGAEAKVEGFSGYLCELLIIHYGSFMSLVSSAKNWKFNHRITLNNNHKKAFPKAPLVVIDPVDSERNVASALTAQNFAMFIHACAEYEKNPSEYFFFPLPAKPFSKRRIHQMFERRGTEIICVMIDKT